MTEEEILEGNDIIYNYLNNDLYAKPYCFHESMDWLLPVINKISKSEQFDMITGNGDDWEVSIETTGYQYVTHSYQVNKNLIEGVWLACVEYIEKFNTGTLKQNKK